MKNSFNYCGIESVGAIFSFLACRNYFGFPGEKWCNSPKASEISKNYG